MRKAEEIYDWKGNEIKAGMTIYFVQTIPGFLESSRLGVLCSDTGKITLEDESQWEERKNKEVWRLGQPFLVEQKEHGLFYTTMPNQDGVTFSFEFQMAFLFGSKPTIAIKGISDIKE